MFQFEIKRNLNKKKQKSKILSVLILHGEILSLDGQRLNIPNK